MLFTFLTAVAYVVGGAMVAFESIDEENKKKQAALDRYREEIEAENRRRAEELRQAAVLTDANAKLKFYERILASVKKAEASSYANWEAAKAQMRSLKQQRKKVGRNCWAVRVQIENYKKKKSRFLFFFTRKVDFSSDKFVREKESCFRQLNGFQRTVNLRIIEFSKEKNRLFVSMQDMNRQAREAGNSLEEFRRIKTKFVCEHCRKEFTMNNAMLAALRRKGNAYPRYCKTCLKNAPIGGFYWSDIRETV